ncbi:MAG: polysaccharide pyruvyl transferase CsaB [Elainellaceae cyanobacterium]
MVKDSNLMRAVLCGYYGMGNGGDEALLASLLQMLPSSVSPLVLSGNPTQTRDRYGVEACDRKSFPALFSALRQSDALIWGGGSLMQDVTSVLNPFYYGGLMWMAQRMGLKTIAWAQGIGPLNRSLTQALTRNVIAHCTSVSVRDQGSAQLASRWRPEVVLAPDPVWALDAAPVPGLWDTPAPRVAVALRPHPALTESRIDQIAQALALFQQATQTYILLIPFQPSRDLPIAEALKRALPEKSEILCLDDPRQLRGVFKGVEMAIAMRFHGLIMAAAAECRCFAISYDPKVDQIMQDLELPGYAVEALPDDPSVLCQIWLEHYANGVSLSSTQVRSLADRALIHQELLVKHLGCP